MIDPADRPDVGIGTRRGDRPETTAPSPHAQVSQNAPVELQETLWARMRSWPDVTTADSLVSVPGARAVVLSGDRVGPPAAFQSEREFAHIHPHHDGSLHITLPDDVGREAVAAGWAEPHPVQQAYLVYGPRDDDELAAVWWLVQVSHLYAQGRVRSRADVKAL